MAEIKNLTEENVEDLEELFLEMQKRNPDLEYKFFKLDKPKLEDKSAHEMLDEILDKVDTLIASINYIFDGNVLIDGSFKKINPSLMQIKKGEVSNEIKS